MAANVSIVNFNVSFSADIKKSIDAGKTWEEGKTWLESSDDYGEVEITKFKTAIDEN